MLDSIKSYKLYYIQKASPRIGDAFDLAHIYKFYTDKTDKCQRLKYIIRVESIKDIFAIKFYAARDKKLDNKYNRIIKVHGYSETLRIFVTCANIVPLILRDFPLSSFVINGAQSLDLQSDKIEDKLNNQRFSNRKKISCDSLHKNQPSYVLFKDVHEYILR